MIQERGKRAYLDWDLQLPILDPHAGSSLLALLQTLFGTTNTANSIFRSHGGSPQALEKRLLGLAAVELDQAKDANVLDVVGREALGTRLHEQLEVGSGQTTKVFTAGALLRLRGLVVSTRKRKHRRRRVIKVDGGSLATNSRSVDGSLVVVDTRRLATDSTLGGQEGTVRVDF